MANEGGKKQFNTKIDGEISDAFRKKCKELDVSMSAVLEQFMQDVVNDNISIKATIQLKRNDNN